MRIILSLLIAIFLLGGTLVYTRFANRIRASVVTVEPDFAVGNYAIEIDRTFDCVPDDLLDDPGLLVRFLGEEVYRSEGTLTANERVRIEELPKVENGKNEINVSAVLDPSTQGLAAMRIRVFRDNAIIQEATLSDTADLGSIGGAVSFEVEAIEGGRDHKGDAQSSEGVGQ